MKLPGHSGRHLTYCLNIHPGEHWEQNRCAIDQFAVPIARRVGGDKPFGLGLRLSAVAAEELAHPGKVEELQALLRNRGLYIFTVNGFPYGTFHSAKVKEGVYAPDWRDTQRLVYTNQLADLMAKLVPEGLYASISTVPGSYRAWIAADSRGESVMAANLAECAWHLHEICEQTGREVVLALEPEPDCAMDTIQSTVDFFERVVYSHGTSHLVARHACVAQEAERILRTHVGLCLDTCHLGVEFESPSEALTAMHSHGIRVAKVQLSAAVRAEAPATALPALERFRDPVYLHQTRIRLSDGSIRRFSDLGEESFAFLAEHKTARELSTHFHVPLHHPLALPLGSTSNLLDAGFVAACLQSTCSHFEVETYTFDVLPAELKGRGVEESVACELEWMLARFSGRA